MEIGLPIVRRQGIWLQSEKGQLNVKGSGGAKSFILCAMAICWSIVGGVVGIMIIVACVFLNNQFNFFPPNGAIFGIPKS